MIPANTHPSIPQQSLISYPYLQIESTVKQPAEKMIPRRHP
jgi:hypothetical protein